MRRPPFPSLLRFITKDLKYSTKALNQHIVAIQDGTFYRRHPSPGAPDSSFNPPLFPRLTFSLSSCPLVPDLTSLQHPHHAQEVHWAIIGPSNAGKTTLLEILKGKHVCLPPTARTFPYLASDEVDNRLRNPSRAIQYVGFDGERGGVGKSGTRGAYISARYESRREDTDFSVLDYLKGDTNLNPIHGQESVSVDMGNLDKVVEDLRLERLLTMPMGNLSNGQTRRARIARALLGKPLMLLLDEPFMGLDPPTITSLSPLLHRLSKAATPRLVLALRPQDPLPEWITHVLQLDLGSRIIYQGKRAQAPNARIVQQVAAVTDIKSEHALDDNVKFAVNQSSGIQISNMGPSPPKTLRQRSITAENVVEMKDVHVRYGEREVLGDWEVRLPKGSSDRDDGSRKGLWWDIKRGERWGVFGPNGSGKTTLISLICSDHPLSYSLPIKIFGRNRLPQLGKPGISIFDIQSRIGQSSPEIHAFFPRNLSLRRVVENAWAETYFGTPRLTAKSNVAVDACLRWFEAELHPAYDPCPAEVLHPQKAENAVLRKTDWAESVCFGEAPFSAQRVALFLRAIVRKPEMVVLDEAFSGMDEYVRDKCMLFLAHGETRALNTNKYHHLRERALAPTAMHDGAMFEGLQDDQTLICVSHVKEEVPNLLERWMCLPEAGTGRPTRFGTFEKPLNEDPTQWEKIWEV